MNTMSVLIKDTTRKEREDIVKKSIALSTLDSPPPNEKGIAYYQKYIDGKMELSEIVTALLTPYKKTNA